MPVLVKGPEIKLVETTLKDVFTAIEQNGLDHVRGEWINFNEDGKPVGACVLGQATINLNVIPFSLIDDEDFSRVLFDGVDDAYFESKEFDEYMYNTDAHSLLTQLNTFKIPQDSPWVYGEGYLGEVIIYWNDKREYDMLGGYTLKTYGEVVEMCREVMTPFFDEKITLMAYVYSN